MRIKTKTAAAILTTLFLTACHSSNPVKLVYPDKIIQHTEWTEEELKKEIAIQHLHRSTDSSTHIIRLKGKEIPHYHDKHDLNVTVLAGKSTIHFKKHKVALAPGDVIFIPKGTYHWAENGGSNASVVFAIFSPAFDGKDKRKAE